MYILHLIQFYKEYQGQKLIFERFSESLALIFFLLKDILIQGSFYIQWAKEDNRHKRSAFQSVGVRAVDWQGRY